MLQARSSGDVNQDYFFEIQRDSSLPTHYSFSAYLQYHNNLAMLINFFLCFMQCCLCLKLFVLFFFFAAVIALCLLSKSVVCYFKNEIKLVFIVTVNNTTAL